MGEIFAVYVVAHRILYDGHTVQLVGILHDHRHCLRTDIGSHSGSHIFPEGGQIHGIPDGYHLQPLLFGITFSRHEGGLGVLGIFVLTDSKALGTA